MKFRVEYAAKAERDLHAAYAWIAADSPLNAARWVGGLENAVNGLARFPERCPLAPESDDLGFNVRQLIHKPYRVLFAVDERSVLIPHIRHGKRRPINAEDLRPQP